MRGWWYDAGMNPVSRSLIALGLMLIIVGVVWHLAGGKIPLGRLPGDFRYEGEHTTIYIPITSSIVVSVLLSLIVYLFRKF